MLISLCAHIIGHSSILEIFYIKFFLCCNWCLFLQCFSIIKGLLYSNVEQTIGKIFQNKCIQHFVNVICKISLQLCSDVSQIFYKI